MKTKQKEPTSRWLKVKCIKCKNEQIIYGTFEKLIKYDKTHELKEPICVIVPGDMHEMELTFLKQYALKN